MKSLLHGARTLKAQQIASNQPFTVHKGSWKVAIMKLQRVKDFHEKKKNPAFY